MTDTADSPESRQIADVAINDEEHPSRRVTLPDPDTASAPPHQPVVDALTDAAQVTGEQPAADRTDRPLDDDDQPVITSA